MKINKQELKKLAQSLHFELDENQLQKLYDESEKLLTNLERFSDISTNDIESMHYPFDYSFHELREDLPNRTEKPKDYLKNAKNIHGKYIVVK